MKEKQIKQTLGNRIKELRQHKKLSQLELATKINVDNNQISKYEHDKIIPAAETLIYLSRALGTSIDYILTGEINSEAKDRLKDKELIELFEGVEKIDDERKKIIKEVIKSIVFKAKIDLMK
ncbi:helix-turn-helix transcriptional regulator [Candidatus Dependentiae bacterium]|nr:helix-turn-helix transcriptional regulator [Candidatus Dependentiae bacterium]